MSTDLDKLNAFQDSILSEIDIEIEQTLSQAKHRADEIISEAKTEFRVKSEKTVADETKAIKNSSMRAVSQDSYEAGREALAYRNSLVTEMFDSVKEKILAFSSSDRYEDYLKAVLKKINEEKPFYSGVVVNVKPSDLAKITGLCKTYPELSIKENKLIKLGGMSFYYPKENFFADRTLDAGLEHEKTDFSTKSELQI